MTAIKQGLSLIATGQPTQALCQALVWIDGDLMLHLVTALRNSDHVWRACLSLAKPNPKRRTV